MNSNGKLEESGLAKIEVKSENPFDLFKEWHAEATASDIVTPNALTLATVNSEGRVSARTLLLRRLEEDGFVIMTDSRSLKAISMNENPKAEIVFFWGFKKDGVIVHMQVRASGGHVEPLAPPVDLFQREPLYCKIRAHICDQGHTVDWEDHKHHHDEVLEKVHKYGEDKVLPMPEHVVAYKLIPTVIEFYYAWGNMIGDRIVFLRDTESTAKDAQWKHVRLAA